MKELDFDELDRAVSSLMGSASKLPPTEEKTLEITPSTPIEPASVSAEPAVETSEPVAAEPAEAETVAVPVTVTQPTPAAAVPAPRRGGRFMDMVNTPSAVKPRTATSFAPSREGLTITPRTDGEADTPTLTSTPEVTPEQLENPAESGDMPDPIALSEDAMSQEAEVVEVPIAAPAIVGASESPFLSDAKVDKRPLNSGNSTDSNPELDAVVDSFDESLLSTESVDPTAKVEDEPPETPKVPELDSNLVAIESNETITETPTTQVVDTAAAAAEVPAPSAPLGATSIAQQYTSQPSSGDQSHAAIYDASEYPEPVSHPAKKKSGWLWVLWVILLLAAGAGGAVVLYTFGIIP